MLARPTSNLAASSQFSLASLELVMSQYPFSGLVTTEMKREFSVGNRDEVTPNGVMFYNNMIFKVYASRALILLVLVTK